MPGEIRYARSGDLNIAYTVAGNGPPDVVAVPPWVSHLEYLTEDPSFNRHWERAHGFARVIAFDKRGTGLSDPIVGAATLEERMDDMRAVMDAAGSKRAVIYGISEGGPMSMLFAATHPERTSALILFDTFACAVCDEDYPWAPDAETLHAATEMVVDNWGTGMSVTLGAPSLAEDERFRQWWARYERLAASPGTVRAMIEMQREVDVRAILPTIRVPTLVLHRKDDAWFDVEEGRYIAEHIPGARFVELPGGDNAPWLGDGDAVLDEIEEFLTGARHGREPDRVLATILITDIVESTKRAAELGDAAWRNVLADHDALVRRQLDRFRGKEIKTMGDGFLATFDGPARGIRCAQAVVEAARGLGVEVRAGLHTGECEVIGDDIGGLAVHIATAVGSSAGAGEVLVSSTVRDLVVGSELAFEERGERTLEGVPGDWRLYAVDGAG